jgi:hypothetical protein
MYVCFRAHTCAQTHVSDYIRYIHISLHAQMNYLVQSVLQTHLSLYSFSSLVVPILEIMHTYHSHMTFEFLACSLVQDILILPLGKYLTVSFLFLVVLGNINC